MCARCRSVETSSRSFALFLFLCCVGDHALTDSIGLFGSSVTRHPVISYVVELRNVGDSHSCPIAMRIGPARVGSGGSWERTCCCISGSRMLESSHQGAWFWSMLSISPKVLYGVTRMLRCDAMFMLAVSRRLTIIC